VIEVCRRANPNLVVKRARFSALILRDLQRAVNNLVEPNEMDARAVDARQEIDLRIGASFTRFQTLLLQVSIVVDFPSLHRALET
jgi:DNA topoisomerase-3